MVDLMCFLPAKQAYFLFRGLTRQRVDSHSVSSRWLPSYLNEYSFRYNERSNTTRAMFMTLLDRAAV